VAQRQEHADLRPPAVGDRGTAAHRALLPALPFVALVEEYLRGCGYTVARNDPHKSVQLIARIGQPALQRHSMQIEVRRPIYMDE